MRNWSGRGSEYNSGSEDVDDELRLPESNSNIPSICIPDFDLTFGTVQNGGA